MKTETQPHIYSGEDGSPEFDGPIAVVVAEAEIVEQLKGDMHQAVSIITPAKGHKCHNSIEVGNSYVVFSLGLWPVIIPDGAPVLLEDVSPDVLSLWRNEP